ncbi:hypothetical protein [Deinococcus soli (ex Cha et al. 2016)]|uniref:Uncharacterized protein n=2 Tax=Deinococcus soli (ex Cha et al. 2016) TaxID=1309411 RepID=A0AAE3XC13_9DEIO|nr:hypothetical protein [Deinococcus soli (ex Cha et al. 2016)]MDR6218266.1 hypothetical protein [Deinococcus soli (ex Cha et al. 2016)]MDR6329006.1 hypothetical protein [Deinococcus soli (ex Cha et al. 2016)]MDR6751279.1 hypothetical protein [Deinococcus soli (ex Cha et al. 2016)]
MNLVETVVIRLLSDPQRGEADGVEWWTVRAQVNSYGHVFETDVTCATEAEARAVQPGYTYLS